MTSVRIDDSRRCCVELESSDPRHALFIMNEDGLIDIYTLPPEVFERRFKVQDGYPVDRAARHYLSGSTDITTRAATTLRQLLEPTMAKINPKSAPKSAAAKETKPKAAPAKAAPAKAAPAKAAPAAKETKPGAVIGKLVNAGKTSAAIAADPKKTAQKLAAAKETAKAASPKSEGGKSRIPGDLKITVLTENPHREGGLAHRTFALYAKSKTVADFRTNCAEADCDANYLHHHVAKGNVKVG